MVLKDDPALPAHHQPTRENIVSIIPAVPVRVDRLTLVTFYFGICTLVARVAASGDRRRAR